MGRHPPSLAAWHPPVTVACVERSRRTGGPSRLLLCHGDGGSASAGAPLIDSRRGIHCLPPPSQVWHRASSEGGEDFGEGLAVPPLGGCASGQIALREGCVGADGEDGICRNPPMPRCGSDDLWRRGGLDIRDIGLGGRHGGGV